MQDETIPHTLPCVRGWEIVRRLTLPAVIKVGGDR